MTISLSIGDARKLVLLSQRVPPAPTKGTAQAATLAVIEHLGYVQIDSISVIQRAHHHTLWSRNPRYRPAQLDALVAERRVFEYWSHAAAYLPMRDYRFSLPRKLGIARGEQEHWYARDRKQETAVLRRITAEGPLMARDFDHPGKRPGDWSAKPAKRALENLFMRGELMSPGRVGFQKVYDLTERVLPADIDATPPSDEEHARHLITRYLRANGLGQPTEIAYLLPGTRPRIVSTLRNMVASGEVVKLRVAGETFHALPASLELLGKRLARSRATILSPFDNLVIQRKRLRKLFDFDYLIECYVPAEKRRYGYFTLPILWHGRLAARMDCKADRKRALLDVHHLELEPWLKPGDRFLRSLKRELEAFLRFNHCDRAVLHRAAPKTALGALREAIDGANRNPS